MSYRRGGGPASAAEVDALLQIVVAPLTRPDGWPLCPGCGADEAYSLEIPADPNDPHLACYACGWRRDTGPTS